MSPNAYALGYGVNTQRSEYVFLQLQSQLLIVYHTDTYVFLVFREEHLEEPTPLNRSVHLPATSLVLTISKFASRASVAIEWTQCTVADDPFFSAYVPCQPMACWTRLLPLHLFCDGVSVG
ncbi:hypothetical protein Y032_0024g1064 [Ancylostoma ceylanicum]|uniref:Uncharacterized protein n=1 Tax=Ancylostoma ceylanicum TaxID=53326 RepID=A0A016UX87_9BILA|nr:hypothetical protein Y032_0024g1064 [Ancylostoma ceylanicum]